MWSGAGKTRAVAFPNLLHPVVSLQASLFPLCYLVATKLFTFKTCAEVCVPVLYPCSPVRVHMDIKLRRRLGKVLGYGLDTELSVTCGSGVARLCCLNSRDKQKQIIKVIPLRGQWKDHLRQMFGDSQGPHYALGEGGRDLRTYAECVLALCFT